MMVDSLLRTSLFGWLPGMSAARATAIYRLCLAHHGGKTMSHTLLQQNKDGHAKRLAGETETTCLIAVKGLCRLADIILHTAGWA